MPIEPNPPVFTTGNFINAADLNMLGSQQVDVARQNNGFLESGAILNAASNAVVETFLGVVQPNSGQFGNITIKGPQYYVSVGVCNNTTNTSILSAQTDLTPVGFIGTGQSATPAPAPYVIATNLAELATVQVGGGTGSQLVPVGQIVQCFAWYGFQSSSGTPPPKMYGFFWTPPAPIICVLTQTGGSNGTQTTAPTYTYTAADVYGNQLGTTLTPQVARQNGTFTAASYGLGYWLSGTFNLLIAFEVKSTTACS